MYVLSLVHMIEIPYWVLNVFSKRVFRVSVLNLFLIS